ncbi:hypothetical protein [Bacillus sp. 007/AIA-02/001]|uniref:hypothetical protein n=1 Tax=Bacillus sp. 007/AIA-02/001 TaxID=2509009 RepID=UPI001F0DCEF8|nr:hypothetical protein [Bacillus sp. 007/AIA-02/001]
MSLLVTFVGTSLVPTPGVSASYKIWSYKIEGKGSEISAGQQWALTLPGNVDVQDPSHFPNVAELAGTFVTLDPSSDIQYVGRTASSTGSLTIAFVAPALPSSGNMSLYKSTHGGNWVSVHFSAPQSGTPGPTQIMSLPAPGAPVYTGRPVYDFTGTLPYASELFGVYQPLFVEATPTGVLLPFGLVNLFREYFFEFDNFLGKPAGHIWVSPGGTVEVVETSTRKTLVEKVAEQSEEISRKTEESLTEQDDVADAIKEENSNDTKLGVSATGGVNAPIYHADVSASFSNQNTVKRASEASHKRTRTQTAKVTSEIKRNFKTSFKTITETTDTSSRRYILQNNTKDLVNYELRRKMRKVGVQLQHVGTRLCWQVYIGDPGNGLGLGDMVHVVEAPDLTVIKQPEKLPLPANKEVPFHFDLSFIKYQGADDDASNTYITSGSNPCHGIFKPVVGSDDIIEFCFDIQLPPVPPGYDLSQIVSVDHHGAQVSYNPPVLLPVSNKIKLQLTYANFQGRKSLPFDFVLLYVPTQAAIDEVNKSNADAEDAYNKEVARLQHEAYGKAVRERLRLVSSLRTRSPEDLRSEERRMVFRNLIQRLENLGHYPQNPQPLPYLESEQIQQFFDVDEMLYFVAPDFWRPGPVSPPLPTQNSVGRYPIPPEEPPAGTTPLPLEGQTVAGWYSRAEQYQLINGQSPSSEWRVDYLITEQTQPAPMGSSIGWLIQIDGDERRNEFLNSAWVKAILPIRPGQEIAALDWLTQVESVNALSLPYPYQPGDPSIFQGKTVGEVLNILAEQLQADNTDISKTLASEKVFETGFDPLAGGFRPADPYEVFDQWIEILPTDQVAAVAVRYDPKTGQQI